MISLERLAGRGLDRRAESAHNSLSEHLWGPIRERAMIRSFALAGIAIAGLAAPALASGTATTKDGLFAYIRSGPGTKYEITCLAWPGVQFTISECTKYWCKARYLQSTGWISKSRISVDD